MSQCNKKVAYGFTFILGIKYINGIAYHLTEMGARGGNIRCCSDHEILEGIEMDLPLAILVDIVDDVVQVTV